MNLIAERVKVTDAAGHDIDVAAALNAPIQGAETDDEADDDESADDESADDDESAAIDGDAAAGEAEDA